MLFRTLSTEEDIEFRQWARENFQPGGTINPLWHPVVRSECDRMNRLAANVASGVCALQPELAEPWKGRCLTHGVPDSMEHHFSVHPDAATD